MRNLHGYNNSWKQFHVNKSFYIYIFIIYILIFLCMQDRVGISVSKAVCSFRVRVRVSHDHSSFFVDWTVLKVVHCIVVLRPVHVLYFLAHFIAWLLLSNLCCFEVGFRVSEFLFLRNDSCCLALSVSEIKHSLHSVWSRSPCCVCAASNVTLLLAPTLYPNFFVFDIEPVVLREKLHLILSPTVGPIIKTVNVAVDRIILN